MVDDVARIIDLSFSYFVLVQTNFISTDNARMLCLSCDAHGSKTTVKFQK